MLQLFNLLVLLLKKSSCFGLGLIKVLSEDCELIKHGLESILHLLTIISRLCDLFIVCLHLSLDPVFDLLLNSCLCTLLFLLAIELQLLVKL